MAEIKSTLDLIMEKTKNMTLTEEEREEILAREWRGKVRGWVQRYLDTTMNEKDLSQKFSKEDSDDLARVNKILKREILERLEPESDNEKILHLIDILPVSDRKSMKQLIESYRKKIDTERAHVGSEIKDNLSVRGVSGTAVVPNLENDTAWKDFLEKAKETLRQALVDQER